ncbi:MAG: ThiF family adenylyltransferase [Streptomycetaceae bacterium]|nr:ThiF family adenylyltransferase [Streptomycetaceae bacterium]
METEADIEVVAAGAQAVSRNLEIINEREQAALRAATVLVSGCGGGSALVEPLARLGVARFRLADPEHFDVSNLNRQACVRADVGKPKAEVLAHRVRAINPSAQVRVYLEGLTLENLDEALDGVHVAFDGIDPQMSAWVKYQLHERAAQRGIPVVAGMDFGGKPVLYVFDYRRNPVPFYGQATAEAHRKNRLWESMRWCGKTHFPSDYLPIMADRHSHGGTWPQISYCITGLAALGSRTMLDLLMNRRTRHVVTVDLHAAAMPRSLALAHRARMPVELLRTLHTIRTAARRTPRRPAASPAPPRPLPERLATVLQGARLAPSPYNAQPWRFELLGDHTIQLAPEPGRWPTTDPDPLGWAESLGCALGTMTYLAHGQWQAHSAEPGRPDWFAGQFHCHRLHEDILARQGAVGLRTTHRDDLLRTPLDATTAKRIEAVCTEQHLALETITGAAALDRLARTELEAAAAIDFAAEAELWAWLRARARTKDGQRFFGNPRDLLGGSPAAGYLAHVLATSAVPHWAAARPLALMAARQRARKLRNCAAVLVLWGPRRTVTDRIEAGAALMHLWLTLTEAGYAAQPLYGEFGRASSGLHTAWSTHQDKAVLAVLRTGRATTTPARTRRCPLQTSVC